MSYYFSEVVLVESGIGKVMSAKVWRFVIDFQVGHHYHGSAGAVAEVLQLTCCNFDKLAALDAHSFLAMLVDR